jgi:hypothetical protein
VDPLASVIAGVGQRLLAERAEAATASEAAPAPEPASEHLSSTLGHTAAIPPPEASEAIAPAAPAEETASAPPVVAKAKRARRESSGDAPATAAATEAAPATAAPAEPQELVLTGGSPFLRVIGFVQQSGGVPLSGFGNVAVSKMSTLPLPTEPGSYEFRFQVRNGTGSFKLAQRNERGTTKNAREFEMDPSGTTQVYRFNIP